MRRRLFISSLGLLLLELFDDGCARYSAPRAEEGITLVFKHSQHPRYAALGQLIREFEAEHTGIRVREEILPSSTDEQHQFYVINLAAHADDFDVVDMDIIWVPEFARAGWLWPLSSQVSGEEQAALNPSALQADRLGGQLYAVPWFLDVAMLFYRTDLLAKYGLEPPRTFPELVQGAQTILSGERNPRLMGFVWQGKQYEGLVCTALEFIRGNGGDLLRRGVNLALTEPATLEALQFMSDLIRVHKVSPPLVTTLNEEAARNIFQSGRAIFMRNWPYAWKLLNEPGSPVAGNVGIALVPHFPGKGSAPTLGGFHLGVNANSRHRGEAAAFVRFMIRHSSQKEVLLKLGVLPARMDVYPDLQVRQTLPSSPALLEALDQMQPRPVTPYYMMISQIVQPELSGVVAGLRAPGRAMQSAEKQIRQLLEAQ